MSSNKRRHKKSFRSEFLFILFGIAVIFLESHPSLRPLRNSRTYIILWKVAVSGAILFFTWIWEKQAPLFEKIALSISALTPWSRAIIKSPRTDLLLQMILFYTLLIILIKHFITNKKCTTISTIVTLFLGIRVLFPKYTYLHNSGDVHFWKIGLTAAFFVTITFIVLTIKQKIHLQNNRIPEKICSYLLVFGATFVLAAYTIANLNYALDHSKSIAYPATVLKKEIRSGTRGATSYVLITNINNEKKNSMYQNQHILMYI